jgi:cell division protein FtsB
MSRELNLAREPFVNRRPLHRVVILLWVLGGLLLLVNGAVYGRYLAASEQKKARLESATRGIAEASERTAALERQLADLDVGPHNQQVGFLNQKIAERTFGWGRLFDRLGEVLPAEVRIYSLSPLSVQPRGRRGDDPPAGDRVHLRILGAARSGESLLELVDAMFAHPAFEEPKLYREALDDGVLRFDVSVVYLPYADDEPEATAAGDEGAGTPAAAPTEGGG